MTTPITTFTTDSQMHNNIMAAGSKDRPPMLVTGRYAEWQSRFLRYIDTRPNGDALRKCILEEKEANPFAIDWNWDEIYSNVDCLQDSSRNVDTDGNVSVHFLPTNFKHEWSKFVTIVKQQHDLDTVSYHKLIDVLKQYQKEVNEIHADRIAKNGNPLALVAATSP
ncbi:hypothetical protein Tco_1504836 [Tanacetum coccineum]